jgi:hypothetical protein
MVVYKDSQSMCEAIRACFKGHKNIIFLGCYRQPEDPLVSNRERVEMTVKAQHESR